MYALPLLALLVACKAVVTAMELTQNHIIKQRLFYRSKYKVGAVPNPKNRGGDAIQSIRAKELAGTLVEQGYDMQEANCNRVLVQEQPAVAGQPPSDVSQADFSSKAQLGPDIADTGDGSGCRGGTPSYLTAISM